MHLENLKQENQKLRKEMEIENQTLEGRLITQIKKWKTMIQIMKKNQQMIFNYQEL